MADLTDSDAERGQLLLVTGFAIAVAIVALVLLLNTAIYTENLATRSVDTGAGDALAYRDTVEDGLWNAVSEVNEGDNATRTERIGNASDRVDRLASLSARRHLLDGRSAAVTNRTYHNGTRLVQTDGNRTVTPAGSSTANWTMAYTIDEARAAEVNVTGGLESTTDPEQGFSIAVVGDNGDKWRVYVYEDSGTGDPTVAVKNGTAPIDDAVCSGQFAGTPRLNLTAGTIDGADCGALAFGTGIDEPYDIVEVRYGNRTTATYTMTVNSTVSPAVDPNFQDSPSSSEPYQVPVVYSMHADVAYESVELTYRARVYAGPEGEE